MRIPTRLSLGIISLRPCLNEIDAGCNHYGDRRCHLSGRARSATRSENNVCLPLNQLCGQLRHALGLQLTVSVLGDIVLSFAPTQFSHFLMKGFQQSCCRIASARIQISHAPYFSGLLCIRERAQSNQNNRDSHCANENRLATIPTIGLWILRASPHGSRLSSSDHPIRPHQDTLRNRDADLFGRL